MVTHLIPFFQSFGNRTRMEIIHLLKKGPLTVTEIYERLGLEQSRVSHNLRFLEKTGVVIAWKFGNWRKYSLNKEIVSPLMHLVEHHVHNLKKNRIEKTVSF